MDSEPQKNDAILDEDQQIIRQQERHSLLVSLDIVGAVMGVLGEAKKGIAKCSLLQDSDYIKLFLSRWACLITQNHLTRYSFGFRKTLNIVDHSSTRLEWFL
jgi:hypothetical protein